jgi:hypothetical protein
MKINRRDYLKRMGAAGMLVGVTGVDGFAHEHGYPPEQCPTTQSCSQSPSSATAPLVWEPGWCKDLPSNPRYVRLIFCGLTGIARNLNGQKWECDVGFHSKGDAPISHHLVIAEGDKSSRAKRFEDRKIETLALTVTNPDPDVDQTYFYQRGPACSRRALSDDRDFRWIVDFDSDYLYGKHLPGNEHLQTKRDVYSPVLRVTSGIFYTLHKTGSTFLARSDNNQYFMDMANVADTMAVNIYLRSGGSVTLKVDSTSFAVQPGGEIYFANHCMQQGTPNGKCKFNPIASSKKQRSDFFLHYKAFELQQYPEYELHLLQSNPGQNSPCYERFRKMDDPQKDDYEKKINDESPCSAAGFGGKTDGLLPPP